MTLTDTMMMGELPKLVVARRKKLPYWRNVLEIYKKEYMVTMDGVLYCMDKILYRVFKTRGKTYVFETFENEEDLLKDMSIEQAYGRTLRFILPVDTPFIRHFSGPMKLVKKSGKTVLLVAQPGNKNAVPTIEYYLNEKDVLIRGFPFVDGTADVRIPYGLTKEEEDKILRMTLDEANNYDGIDFIKETYRIPRVAEFMDGLEVHGEYSSDGQFQTVGYDGDEDVVGYYALRYDGKKWIVRIIATTHNDLSTAFFASMLNPQDDQLIDDIFAGREVMFSEPMRLKDLMVLELL